MDGRTAQEVAICSEHYFGLRREAVFDDEPRFCREGLGESESEVPTQLERQNGISKTLTRASSPGCCHHRRQ